LTETLPRSNCTPGKESGQSVRRPGARLCQLVGSGRVFRPETGRNAGHAGRGVSMPARKIYCKSCGKRAFKFSQNSRQSWGKIPTIREVYKCSTCQEKTVFLLIEESGHDKRETMLMEEIDKLRANVARQRELLRVKREEQRAAPAANRRLKTGVTESRRLYFQTLTIT